MHYRVGLARGNSRTWLALYLLTNAADHRGLGQYLRVWRLGSPVRHGVQCRRGTLVRALGGSDSTARSEDLPNRQDIVIAKDFLIRMRKREATPCFLKVAQFICRGGWVRK
jgi:hypothetical protein